VATFCTPGFKKAESCNSTAQIRLTWFRAGSAVATLVDPKTQPPVAEGTSKHQKYNDKK